MITIIDDLKIADRFKREQAMKFYTLSKSDERNLKKT